MAYKKSQTPPRVGDDYIYMPTTADQVILSDGTRLEQGGKLPWVYKRVAFSVTFPADGWSTDSAPYTQTIAVEGVRVSDDLKADVDMSKVTVDTFKEMERSWCSVDRLVAQDGAIVAYCFRDYPSTDLTINFSGLREV